MKPTIVHKVHYNGNDHGPSAADMLPDVPSAIPWEMWDEIMDVMAAVLVDLRKEWRKDVEERMQTLERRIDAVRDSGDLRGEIGELHGMLATLINKSTDKTIETTASEVVRKVTKRQR